MIVEGKNYSSLQKYYMQLEAYARFLTVPNAKAIFYLFLGMYSHSPRCKLVYIVWNVIYALYTGHFLDVNGRCYIGYP